MDSESLPVLNSGVSPWRAIGGSVEPRAGCSQTAGPHPPHGTEIDQSASRRGGPQTTTSRPRSRTSDPSRSVEEFKTKKKQTSCVICHFVLGPVS